MLLEAGMVEVEVVTQQIFVGFEFLGLLVGGRLTRAQEAGTLDSKDVKERWDELRA